MIKLYLKLFIISGFPFALITGIIFSYKDGVLNNVIFGTISGLLFGLTASSLLMFLHISLSRKAVPEKKDYDLAVHQKDHVKVPLPLNETFILCLESLHTINKCKIEAQTLFQGKITARAGLNWKTWGDIISLKLKKINNDTTYVYISSRPYARTTLLDFGKNLQNVWKIKEYLLGHAGIDGN
ncbi:MAG: hypothetical protein ABFR82_10020 [Nitrospirota bacterium]